MTQTEKKYWFKRRRYGYGWTPVTWQGWLTVLVPMAIVITCGFLILPPKPQEPTMGETLMFLAISMVSIATMVATTVVKGPPARWRWGAKPDDNPDEDF